VEIEEGGETYFCHFQLLPPETDSRAQVSACSKPPLSPRVTAAETSATSRIAQGEASSDTSLSRKSTKTLAANPQPNIFDGTGLQGGGKAASAKQMPATGKDVLSSSKSRTSPADNNSTNKNSLSLSEGGSAPRVSFAQRGDSSSKEATGKVAGGFEG
jgi:hypothetical protein